jgi:hypothetical protein
MFQDGRVDAACSMIKGEKAVPKLSNIFESFRTLNMPQPGTVQLTSRFSRRHS